MKKLRKGVGTVVSENQLFDRASAWVPLCGPTPTFSDW